MNEKQREVLDRKRERERERISCLLSATIALVKGLDTLWPAGRLDCSDILLGVVGVVKSARDGEEWPVMLEDTLKDRSSSSLVAEKDRENKKETKEGNVNKQVPMHI